MLKNCVTVRGYAKLVSESHRARPYRTGRFTSRIAGRDPVLLPKTVTVATRNTTKAREATSGFVNHFENSFLSESTAVTGLHLNVRRCSESSRCASPFAPDHRGGRSRRREGA